MSKKDLTEEDIKLKYITPSIVNKGWSLQDITMETKVKLTDGKINLRGNMVAREKAKFADYVLYYNRATPIAIVEAKDANHTVAFGMQQAKEYARMMDIPFAFSSNGLGYQEYDFLTGRERSFPMDAFPTKEELYARFLTESNGGKGLSDKEKKVINQPYCTGQDIFPPRYYQRNAVNRTVNAVAQGKKRLLLVMATGTGKTYTAFQIVYRLLQSRLVKKVLYLADRNVLVDQSIQQDFKPLSNIIHKVDYQKDIATHSGHLAYEVYFSLYQQLIGKEGKQNYKELFKPEFFDMVIVDECHRGSANDDSNWREILEYFDCAVQLGMTATPKETKYQSSISYFGEPIYTYSLKEGIEDGFLAPFKVVNITTNIGDEWRPIRGQRDIYGNLIEDRIYNNSDYDYNIIIQDRIDEIAAEITKYLKETDRMSKTIVFCPTEDAADRMRVALNNLNTDMVQKDNQGNVKEQYVVRITGSDKYGKEKLDYFISVSQPYPVIATTSKLLSTGSDCKMVKLIVIDELINSMTEFKQIIGRGTRLRYNEGKTHFTIMDFRRVSRLFADPDWDGEIELDEDFDPDSEPKTQPEQKDSADDSDDGGDEPGGEGPTNPKVVQVIGKGGVNIKVLQRLVSIYDTDGKLLKQESIEDYTKESIIGTYQTLENFIQTWNGEQKKEIIRNMLKEKGIDLELIKKDQNMTDVDDFDFICHIAFNQKPLTRRERAENVKKRDIFGKYGEAAKEVIEALLDKYAELGIYDIESTEILKQNPFTKYGKPARIAALFGGNDKYRQAIRELEAELYKVA